jgi:hypothetical protein
MIKNHPLYRFPNELAIQQCIEYNGYDYFLPKKLLYDLINLYCYYNLNGSIEEAINEKFVINEYQNRLLIFYRSLNLDNFNDGNPLNSAIVTLKELANSINFRSIEDGKNDFVAIADNYLEELTDQDRTLLNIDDKELIASIIKISKKIKGSINKSEKYEEDIISSKMKNFRDVLKIKRSELVRKDFTLKLTHKNFLVKNKEEHPTEDIIIYLEDASTSMMKKENFVLIKAVQRILCNIDKKVHYYRYFGNKTEFFELNDEESKLKEFKAERKYFKTNCDYYNLLSVFNQKYNNGEILMVTDCKDSLPNIVKTNLIFNCISRNYESGMNNFIKFTNGKYLIYE